MPRVVVIQRGGRHRYAIARIFYRMGYLSQLVTDAHAGSNLGKLAMAFSKLPLPSSVSRLRERRVEEIPPVMLHSCDAWLWKMLYLQRLRRRNTAEWLKARDIEWFSLTKDTQLDQVDALYSMGGENLSILKKAKQLGVKVIVDAFISPINLRQTFAAKKKIGIEPTLSEVNHRDVELHYQSVFDVADVILCPSKWVAEGVLTLEPAFASKIRICAYGSSLKFSSYKRAPVPGRIFWAGSDWFRKGLHHLAKAADSLKLRYSNFDFRVAGITDPKVISMPRFKNLNFLGKLARSEMEREFSSADIFVLPTLTEGMASVITEAIASGCPTITTRGAGIDAIEHNRSGLIIEPEDYENLSEEIESLFLDRQRLINMSKECSKLASQYTEDAWALRLKELVLDLVE